MRFKEISDHRKFKFSGEAVREDNDGIYELIKDFFQSSQSPDNLKLYEKIAEFERKQVEGLLERLACVFRDLIILSCGHECILFLGDQTQQELEQWARYFSRESLEYLTDLVLNTKDHIKKNSNIKLSIDLLVKQINKHKIIK